MFLHRFLLQLRPLLDLVIVKEALHEASQEWYDYKDNCVVYLYILCQIYLAYRMASSVFLL